MQHSFHLQLLTDDEKIVGVGMIGPYWNSQTESSFFTIFIDPDYKGKGLGRKIIETLKEDEYYKIVGVNKNSPASLFFTIKNPSPSIATSKEFSVVSIEPEVKLVVTVSAEQFDVALDAAFEKVVKEIKVDGFRPGKLPKSIYVSRFGWESLYNEAIEFATEQSILCAS